jgi:copper chaperone CopZ
MAVEYLLVPSIASDRDVQTIRAALSALPGVILATVSLPNRRVRVEHTGQISVEQLVRALTAAGYAQVAVLA